MHDNNNCINRIAGLRREIGELVTEKAEFQRRAWAVEDVVAKLRDALIKAVITPVRGDAGLCTVCRRLGGIHAPDCYVGQALATADAVLKGG